MVDALGVEKTQEMHSVMMCHAASCYQSNLDHLWTTKDDAFRDVISACERCGESNEAPKCLFLLFLFLSSTCP